MTLTQPARVFIYTALPCEAKPLVDYFKLKKQTAISNFAVYYANDIYLIVTGMGKNAMAAGVAYSQALFAGTNPVVMLNIGIAGHKNHPVGSLFLVHKCTDSASGKNHFPPLVFNAPCASSCLYTQALPQLTYTLPGMVDMEAAAFFEIAARFNSAELNQSLKIISDNISNPAQNIQAAQVSMLIAAHTAGINTVLSSLRLLAASLSADDCPVYQAFLERFRFSASEQLQLKNLLKRWRVVTAQPVPEIPEQLGSGNAIIRWLEQLLKQTGFYL